MFGFNKIDGATLVGRALGVSRNCDVQAIEEGIRITYESSENAQSLQRTLQREGVRARVAGQSVVVPFDSIEGEDFGQDSE